MGAQSSSPTVCTLDPACRVKPLGSIQCAGPAPCTRSSCTCLSKLVHSLTSHARSGQVPAWYSIQCHYPATELPIDQFGNREAVINTATAPPPTHCQIFGPKGRPIGQTTWPHRLKFGRYKFDYYWYRRWNVISATKKCSRWQHNGKNQKKPFFG